MSSSIDVIEDIEQKNLPPASTDRSASESVVIWTVVSLPMVLQQGF
jgi:hypothetical protein